MCRFSISMLSLLCVCAIALGVQIDKTEYLCPDLRLICSQEKRKEKKTKDFFESLRWCLCCCGHRSVDMNMDLLFKCDFQKKKKEENEYQHQNIALSICIRIKRLLNFLCMIFGWLWIDGYLLLIQLSRRWKACAVHTMCDRKRDL